jgi:hypothetical protein
VSLRKVQFAYRGLFATIAIAALFVANAPIASAAALITGSGAGTGGDYGNPDTNNPCPGPLSLNPLSAYVTDYVLGIDDTGTYAGGQAPNVQTALYIGPSHITVTAVPHYISPIGTHDPNLAATTLGASCNTPEPITITAQVTSPGSAGINCPSASGQMIRAQSAVTITFTSSCTLKGNQTPLNGTVPGAITVHTLQGTLTPCYVPPPILTSPENEACTAQRAAAPPGLPPYPPVGSPGSLWLGTYQAAGATVP